MELEIETDDEKAFFESDGEAAPEPEKQEAAPEPEKQIDAAAEQPEKSERDSMVPYSALHEERMMRKETQQELKEMRDKLDSYSSLREELNQIRNANKSEKEQERYEEDPIGYLREQQEKLQETVQQTTSQREREQTQLREVQELQSTINAQVNSFVKDNPDYEQALQFMSERRIQDLTALGITDPQTQQQIINTEAWNIAQTSLQNNKNPAEVVYTMAKSWGYNAAGKAGKTDLENKVDTIEKGQQESKTLSDAGGAAESTGLSLADIETMSDEEFDKLWSTLEKNG